jgi:hypothetical protein
LVDLAVFYEHPPWFEALFATLDRRGLDWTAKPLEVLGWDPHDRLVDWLLPLIAAQQKAAA